MFFYRVMLVIMRTINEHRGEGLAPPRVHVVSGGAVQIEVGQLRLEILVRVDVHRTFDDHCDVEYLELINHLHFCRNKLFLIKLVSNITALFIQSFASF